MRLVSVVETSSRREGPYACPRRSVRRHDVQEGGPTHVPMSGFLIGLCLWEGKKREQSRIDPGSALFWRPLAARLDLACRPGPPTARRRKSAHTRRLQTLGCRGLCCCRDGDHIPRPRLVLRTGSFEYRRARSLQGRKGRHGVGWSSRRCRGVRLRLQRCKSRQPIQARQPAIQIGAGLYDSHPNVHVITEVTVAALASRARTS